MEKQQNRLISVAYKLYSVADGKKELEEMTHEDHPFEFISGFGVALDGFERNVVGLAEGSDFEFTLDKAEAFGNYAPEGVHKVERETFSINGHFDHENIFEGAVITLVDEDDHRFMARIVKVEDDGVTIDTNPPLAGKDLFFTGKVLTNREATNDEIQAMVNRMSGEGCCCCDDCNGDHHHDHCDHHHHGGDHHHHDGDHCGCGHCH